jgi:hypothetical protein
MNHNEARHKLGANGGLTAVGLTRVVDGAGLLAGLLSTLYALLAPGDPLALAQLATAFCLWVALRCISICGCGGRWWPAPALLFILLSFITNHIGAFYHYREPTLSTSQAAWVMIWAFNLAYLAFAAGTWIYARATRLNASRMVDGFYAQPLTLPAGHEALVLPTLIIYAIGAVCSMILMGGELPILDSLKMVLSGRFWAVHEVANQAREVLYNSEERPAQGYFGLMREAVVPMMVLLWFATWRCGGRRLYVALWVIGLAGTVVLLTGVLQRAPLLAFLMQLTLTVMILSPPRPSVRWAYALGGAFLLLVMMSLLLGRGMGTHSGLVSNVGIQAGGVLNRLYASNSLSGVKVFELFPSVLPFRDGGQWLNAIADLAPNRPGGGIGREIYAYLAKGPGSAGVHFIAEMWLNGGWLSVALVSFLVGFFMQWLNFRCLAMRDRTPLSLVLWAQIFFCIGLAGWGGLLTPIYRGLPVYIIMGWILNRLISLSAANAVGAAGAPQVSSVDNAPLTP